MIGAISMYNICILRFDTIKICLFTFQDFTLTGGAFAYANHYDWFVKKLEAVGWPCAIDLRNNPISNVRTKHRF